MYFFKEEHGNYGWAGADYNVAGGTGAFARIDYQTGKVRWNHEIGGGGGAGVLTTTTGVTFTGDARGNALALRTTDGSHALACVDRRRQQLARSPTSSTAAST